MKFLLMLCLSLGTAPKSSADDGRLGVERAPKENPFVVRAKSNPFEVRSKSNPFEVRAKSNPFVDRVKMKPNPY